MLKKNKRLWAGLLSLALIVTQFSATAAAREDDEALTVGMSNEVDSGQIQDDDIVDNPITVGESDEKDSLVKTITSWKFVDEENLSEGVLALPGVSMEHQADFDTVVSMLPTQINAVIEGKEDSSTLGIPGWACPEFVQDEKLNYPVSGEFTFTAKLPDGYACEPLPSVKVLLGGANLYAAETGDFTVTGGHLGVDYSYNDNTLTINTSTALTITGTTTTDKIQVPSNNVNANLTLSGVNIDVSGTNYACAFAVEAGGTASITLSGTNTLSSGWGRAGLEVPENANVLISGSGELNAKGGWGGAGIGGVYGGAGGTIEISGGTVNANGGDYGAGIGGGSSSNGGYIHINGGTVEATGGYNAAGIGGGHGGGSGNITIEGDARIKAIGGDASSLDRSSSDSNGLIIIRGNAVVEAMGGSDAAGIGGGGRTSEGGAGIGGGSTRSDNNKVEISENAQVKAMGGRYGAGIGGGSNGSGGTIEIKGGTVEATGGKHGAGIGGGSGSGGRISIHSGTVNAYGGDGINGGAGIGGGGYDGSGGVIQISGGMIHAEGGTGSYKSGAGIGGGGSPNATGTAGNITVDGNTVVFAKGGNTGVNAIGSGEHSSDTTAPTLTQGVVFEGNTGTVYGSPELPGDLTIPAGSTLTVSDGSTLTIPDSTTLTIPDGTTLTNNGTVENYGIVTGGGSITNSGTVNDNSGGISVTVTGTAANKPSEVEISFWNSQNGQITQAAYGDTIKITATAQRKATNTLARGAVLNKVDFYIGSVASGNHLGTADISSNSSTATATLDITLSGADWDKGFVIGSNIITADFGGSSALNLLDSVGTATLTVRPQTQDELKLHGLASAYTYGDTAFRLSTTGGSGSGAVSYTSSNPSVASVSGNTVTIRKAGSFTITATKERDGNYGAKTVTSGTVTVREATPNLTLTATGGETVNKPITLTATVSKVGIGTTPTGTVTFRDGNTVLAADVRLDGAGKATYTVDRPTVGNHTYTVEYSGQAGYYNRNSATCTVDVESADQTGFMIESPGAKSYGDGRFTLTTSGGQSTGSVNFSVPDGNGVLTVTDAGEVEIIGVGSVKVTATKAGDSDYHPATATLDINVAPRDISNAIVSVKGSHVYTGNQIQPDFEVTDGTIAITKDDYTHQYDTNVDAGTDAGGIILTGQRNYTGSKTVKFDIEPHPLTDAVITLESGPFVYTGKAIEPVVTSVDVNGIPVPAESFEVGYADNIKAGTATVTITAKADSNFSGTASTTFMIESVKNNSSGSTIISGGSSPSRDNDTSSDKETTKSQPVPEPKRNYKAKGNKINQTISRSDLRKLSNSGKSLTLTSDKSSMVFKPAALKAILAAVPTATTNITFNATPADLGKFPDAAKLIGSHPVYDFTISYKSNNAAVPVKVNLPAGSVSIGVNYTPASTEITGNLFLVYVDGKGAVTWLNKSSYANGKVSAEVSHFSTFGVAYKSPETMFTDIGNHSAKKDIEWAAARDLFPDAEKALFSPDSPITKGMLVTALGKLSGVEPKNYQSRNFTDVKTDDYYAPYAEWAVQKNIIKSTDKNLFSPNEPITRENLAVIMANYAKQSGYSLSSPAAAVTFTDNDKISAWAKKEVTMMQRAGIMKGKDGSRFEPQTDATRGEVSAILRRFVELMV